MKNFCCGAARGYCCGPSYNGPVVNYITYMHVYDKAIRSLRLGICHYRALRTGNFNCMQTAFWIYRLVYSALINFFFFLAETSTIPRNKTGSDILLTNDCQQNISLQQVMVPQCHATSSSSPSATKCWILPLPAQLQCSVLYQLFSRTKVSPPPIFIFSQD